MGIKGGNIIKLAEGLVAAYREIPYRILYTFLNEKAEQYPGDRVIQHVGSIIEKRLKAQPYGTIYVKDLDSLISELSAHGDTNHIRMLFSKYLEKIHNADERTKISSEVYDDGIRDPREIKKNMKKEAEMKKIMQKEELLFQHNVSKILISLRAYN